MNLLLSFICFFQLLFVLEPQAVSAQSAGQQKAGLLSKKDETLKSLSQGRLKLKVLEDDRLSRLEELEQLYAAKKVVKTGFADSISGEIASRASELKEIENEKADLLEQMESFQYALDQINDEIAILDKEMK